MMTLLRGMGAGRCWTVQSYRAVAVFLLVSRLCVDCAIAATLPVLNCADDGNAGSLRSVIATALSGDTVDLTGLSCASIALASGELVVGVDDLSIIGPGNSSFAIDAVHASRIFRHSGSGTLEISDMTLENGNISVDGTPARGGCILSTAAVTLNRTKVTGCTATGNSSAAGGGIYAMGYLTLNASVLSDNSAVKTGVAAPYPSAAGGGAWAHTLNVRTSSISANSAVDDVGANAGGGGIFADLLIFSRFSTFDHNIADYGGGIAVLQRNATVFTFSTISSNVATVDGGGLYGGEFEVDTSTVTANSSGRRGGGVYGNSNYGWVGMRDAIIYGNSAPDAVNSDIDGDHAGPPQQTSSFFVICDDHDIVGNTERPLTGSSGPIRTDPLLESLSDKGGPTRTHAFRDGSPALDAGSGSNAPVSGYCDQRQLPRRRGAGPDIGAYEDQGDTVFYGSFDNCT